MKKTIAMPALVLVCILLASCAGNPTGSGSAPELSSVKDRFVWLIENSKDYNVIYFGEGYPTYGRHSPLSHALKIYENSDAINGYEQVMDEAKFSSLEKMGAGASVVFGADYSESLAIALEDPSSATVYTRYYVRNGRFFQSGSDRYVRVGAERIYDYSSMQIVSPSNEIFVTVSIRSYSMDAPGEYRTFNLTFVKESGEWYLDSPTY